MSDCAMNSNFRTTALFTLLVFTGSKREPSPTAVSIVEIPNVIKDDGCYTDVVDTPSVKTSITIAGKTKSVEHQHGCKGPLGIDQLTALEDKIDEVVNSSRWFDENNQ